MPRWYTSLACLLLFAASFAAKAQVRAWIDRAQVALGETLTLNVGTTDARAGTPDWSPQVKDSILSGNKSRRQHEIVNGPASTRTLLASNLQPRHEGERTLPALAVAGQRIHPPTQPVSHA